MKLIAASIFFGFCLLSLTIGHLKVSEVLFSRTDLYRINLDPAIEALIIIFMLFIVGAIIFQLIKTKGGKATH